MTGYSFVDRLIRIAKDFVNYDLHEALMESSVYDELVDLFYKEGEDGVIRRWKKLGIGESNRVEKELAAVCCL